MTASYEQLIAEHDDLSAQAAAIVRMTRGALDAKAVAKALDRLAVAVEVHLANEDGLIYPVASHLREIGQDGDVAVMTEQLAALRADWCDYLARWSEDRIVTRPDEFRAATDEIMARLDQRVRTETEMLYPVALREGFVTLRDPSAVRHATFG